MAARSPSRCAGAVLTSITEPTGSDVDAAAERIAGRVRRTPVLDSEALNRALGLELHFKCENLQIGGAFKLRGASNAVALLPPDTRSVCTHSSGNHGAALARAAHAAGLECIVVVPEGAAAIKRRNIEAAGGRIVDCAPTQAAREAAAERVCAETGAELIPPYDDARIIAGQGTAVRELLEDRPGLDAILVPVGGGGLAAGAVLAAGGRVPVHGVEPAGADDAARSLAAGRRITEQQPDTLCDGLRATLGALNFALLNDRLAGIDTVPDAQTVIAMRRLWDELKLVVEPSAAICLAAVQANPDRYVSRRVGIVLTGGNVDLDRLPW